MIRYLEEDFNKKIGKKEQIEKKKQLREDKY